MCIYITGPSDVGKSYVIQGLSYLKPMAPSLTNEDNFRFSELQRYNHFAIQDDGQVEFTNQKDSGYIIQVLGGQQVQVNAKYQLPSPAYITPIIVLSNMYKFVFKGFMSASNMSAAMESRYFIHKSMQEHFPVCQMPMLHALWQTVIQMVHMFPWDPNTIINKWREPFDIAITSYVHACFAEIPIK